MRVYYIIEEKLPWKEIAHRSPKNLPNAKRDDVFKKDDDWWKIELKGSGKYEIEKKLERTTTVVRERG